MKEIKSINNSVKLSIVILLIFLIIFYNDLTPKNKTYKNLIYCFLFTLFIISLVVLKKFPEILILYSTFFIFMWYEYNLNKNN
jgi:RsiW-degrading membrane proteinase PrsW (M82 family)